MKLHLPLIAALACFGLAACGQPAQETSAATDQQPEADTSSGAAATNEALATDPTKDAAYDPEAAE